ncbi:MAG TPA: hypothetical protein VNW29_04435 [Candidatus Sulfotelmatobacter sp.]|jgi:hypothetical protein|nr:hypothetical protein [Candidatus Sulfotelmatobacter sp.]
MINNRIESFAKYAGLATVGVEWLALLLYYIQMPIYFGGKYPISYFASLPQTRFVFNICYTLAGLFFWIFVRHHLHKYYRIPIKIFTLSMILFVCLALVPFNPDNAASTLVHDTLAWSSGILFAISMYVIGRNSHNKLIHRVSFITILLSLLLITTFATVPKNSHIIFATEAGAWLVWQIWVLWISYYTNKYNLLKNRSPTKLLSHSDDS